MLFPEQVVLLNKYGYPSKNEEVVDQHRVIEIKLFLPELFIFFGLLSACDVLQCIVKPVDYSLERLFDITIHGLEQKLTKEEIEKLKDPRFKNANDIILRACKHFYDQITNKGLTDAVLKISIDDLFNGKKASNGDVECHGLTTLKIRFPLFLATNEKQQKQILAKFKQVAKLYIEKGFKSGIFMTPEEIDESFFKGVSGFVSPDPPHDGGSSKKRTKSAKRKSTKRNRSNRHRRRPHRRTSRK